VDDANQEQTRPSNTARAAPRIFLSYSWTDPDHERWVEAFACRLAGDGVYVLFDKWDLEGGKDKYAFMERMVTDPEVSKVLCICDEAYAQKANDRRGGVGEESQIISPEIYGKVEQTKFLAIVREKDEEGKPYLPVFFKQTIYHDLSNEEAFEENYDCLIRQIHGRPQRTRPKLGQPPAHIFADTLSDAKLRAKLDRFVHAAKEEKTYADGALSGFFDELAADLAEIKPFSARQPNTEMDITADRKKIIEAIGSFKGHLDCFADVILAICEFRPKDSSFDIIHEFLEKLLSDIEAQENGLFYEHWKDHVRFLHYELFLYLVAILIYRKHFAAANRFMTEGYFHDSSHTSGHWRSGCGDFACQIVTFEDGRFRSEVTTPGMLAQRATHRKIRYKDLFQADFVIWLRKHFPSPGHCGYWNARCIERVREAGTLELFARADTPKGLASLKSLFSVASYTDLAIGLYKAQKSEENRDTLVRSLSLRSNFHLLCNLEVIDRLAAPR
jgi:hypothetical protein